jgi:thymidylate synthase (FAD)
MAGWYQAMLDAEDTYDTLISLGSTPQEARSVLPNSLKTEIICTMNLREWRHFFKLRTSKAAHPQMRELVIPLLAELKEKVPVVFDDIEVEK